MDVRHEIPSLVVILGLHAWGQGLSIDTANEVVGTRCPDDRISNADPLQLFSLKLAQTTDQLPTYCGTNVATLVPQ